MSLSVPSLDKVKLIIGGIILLILISVGIGTYVYVKTLLNEKDARIATLEKDLKDEVTNSATERANVITLKYELKKLSIANDELNTEFNLAKAEFELWKASKPEVKYVNKVIKEIIRIPAEESDFCKAAKSFNEKLSELNYDEI